MDERVADLEIAGHDPSKTGDVEGVLRSNVDPGAVGDGDGCDLVGVLLEQAGDCPQLGLAGVEVAGPNSVADFDIPARLSALGRLDLGASDETVACRVIDLAQNA